MLKVTITGKLSKEKVKRLLEAKLAELKKALQESYPELREVLRNGLVKFETKVEVSGATEAQEIFKEDSYTNVTKFLERANQFYDNLTLQSKEVAGPDALLAKPVTCLDLPSRTLGIIENSMGIKTLGELVERTEQEFLAQKGFGKAFLGQLEEELNRLNPRLHLKKAALEDSGM